MTSEQELKALAAQLRHPSGEKGVEIANMMNETNIGMTNHAVRCLNIHKADMILELGHGNARHVESLFQQYNNIHYYGLEMSELMNEEARKINQVFIANKQAHFYLYAGKQFPFAGDLFDKIFTVNTIYFWEEPQETIGELYRVIKPGGRLCITLALESFMQQLPFTQFGFELYNIKKIEKLIAFTSFRISNIETALENVKTKTGEIVEREFVSVVVEK
ncbi:MAG: class I SAM-dependent methyltransferase [Terrimonas sp.]|mgnify:CR=1 FL=1|nr:class I SAM-dependent methyltransferase [Terrimonas sp.]OJY79636.1 MAG: methyltransferase type 11 [Sphingobacteriales bacterium 40-81]